MHTRKEVGPWLAAIARGDTALGRQETRSVARSFGIETRDDLHAPGLLDDAMRRRIRAARAAGLDVEIRPIDNIESPNGVYLRLLDRLLDLTGTIERIGS